MQYPSRLIETAVNEVAKLPGIGKKTALRLVLHLLKEEDVETHSLANALTELRDRITYCEKCFNISDDKWCSICTGTRRDASLVCVVEDTRDVMAIENTGQFQGMYHVLGGVISPVEGIGPEQLTIEPLIERLTADDTVREVIFALSPTMEGDTTIFYITKKLKRDDLSISSIARGIPIGGELEYTDEITLGRSILTRREYDPS